ncbi:hypothetical protein QBC40DRAFT_214923 [Triangularia verruculosa]|uniref:Uncharacterized protein n=1 Tax=Triangularia verruculosa TaxID=2587418 RepID=A0AAN6XTI0_9PEZI|nr:hypothetical protein QBC40DRAFT_214923 [Triangularia verruculosa]
MAPDDDRLVAFTKTVESAIAKQFKDLVATEFQRINDDHHKRVEIELERYDREKKDFLETAKTALSTAISKDKLEDLAQGLLDSNKSEELAHSDRKPEPSTSTTLKPAEQSKPLTTQPDFGSAAKRPRVSFPLPTRPDQPSPTRPDPPVRSDLPSRPDSRVISDNPTVYDWEVEGEEYIFEDQDLKTGWIVLRCNQGRDIAPLKFPELAYNHFNGDDDCVGHDANRHYTKEEIIEEFSHRVVDTEGFAPSMEWVLAANGRLATNQMRMSQRGQRRSSSEYSSD